MRGGRDPAMEFIVNAVLTASDSSKFAQTLGGLQRLGSLVTFRRELESRVVSEDSEQSRRRKEFLELVNASAKASAVVVPLGVGRHIHSLTFKQMKQLHAPRPRLKKLALQFHSFVACE